MATSYSDISYQYAMDRANNPGLHSYHTPPAYTGGGDYVYNSPFLHDVGYSNSQGHYHIPPTYNRGEVFVPNTPYKYMGYSTNSYHEYPQRYSSNQNMYIQTPEINGLHYHNTCGYAMHKTLQTGQYDTQCHIPGDKHYVNPNVTCQHIGHTHVQNNRSLHIMQTDNSNYRSTETHTIREPDLFNGTSKLEWLGYLKYFETISELNQWPDCQMAKVLVGQLRGEAQKILNTLTYHQFTSYRTLKTIISEAFHSNETQLRDQLIFRFHNCQQMHSQTLSSYSNELQALAREAYMHNTISEINKLVLDQFIIGVLNPEIKHYLRHCAPRSVEEAIYLAEEYTAMKMLRKETEMKVDTNKTVNNGIKEAIYTESSLKDLVRLSNMLQEKQKPNTETLPSHDRYFPYNRRKASMYQTHVKRLRHSIKHSNKNSSYLTETTQVNKLIAISLLEKAKLNCSNNDQNEIDLKENQNSVWLSTELDDIDISLTENSIRLSTESKQTSTVNDEVKAKGLILWPESQPSALKIQNGHQLRLVISHVQIKYQMKILNRKLSHYHFHLSSCSVLQTAMINTHCTFT